MRIKEWLLLQEKSKGTAEEASYWVEQMSRPVVDASVAARFDHWMESDPVHREAFAELRSLWNSSALTEALLETARESDETRPQTAATSAHGRLLRRIWAGGIAATVMIAAVLLLFIQPENIFPTQTYRTARGAMTEIALTDGSHVTLSGDAELQVHILPWERTARLVRGEALLDVAHETLRSFTVESGPARIKVLGTRFNVDAQGVRGVNVQVFRGVVSVEAANGDYIVLRKGQAVRAMQTGLQRKTAFAVTEMPDWVSGWFEMSNEPLDLLIEKLNRRSSLKIRSTSSQIGDMKISGRFHISQPNSVLSAIEIAYGIHSNVRNGEIIISR